MRSQKYKTQKQKQKTSKTPTVLLDHLFALFFFSNIHVCGHIYILDNTFSEIFLDNKNPLSKVH